MTSWCILRCSGQNTLPLMRSLAKAGFEVWAPVELKTRRVTRANVKRRVEQPLMPGYLFAHADQVVDLIQLAATPGNQHRDFRVYQRQDRAPLIDDADLAPLRIEERKVKPKDDKPRFEPGEDVRINDGGGFEGLSGTVEASRGEFVTVRLPGFHMSIKVRSFYLLREDSGSDKRRAA